MTRYGDRIPQATDHWVPVSGGANRGGYMNHCGGTCDAAKAIQSPGEGKVAFEAANPIGQLDGMDGVRVRHDEEHAEGEVGR